MNDEVADRTQFAETLQVSVRDEESSAALVLAVSGEVDLLTAGQLTDAVTAALTRRPSVLVIDLTAVTFLDSSGLSVLVQAHASGGPGTTVRLVTVEDSLAHRAITLTGLDRLLPVFAECSDALAPR